MARYRITYRGGRLSRPYSSAARAREDIDASGDRSAYIEESSGDGRWRRLRSSNPGPGRHTKEWDDCVRDVKKKGGAADPYAVCTAALGEMAYRKTGKRAKNPFPLLFGLDEVGDVAETQQIAGSLKSRKRRKNPWPKGKVPPHLRRFTFKSRG